MREAAPDVVRRRVSEETGVLVALVVATTAFALQQLAVVPAFPVVQSELGASDAYTAWLLSLYLLVASVSAPFLGAVADRRGTRVVLLGALAVFLVGTVAAAVAPTLPWLLAARALQGVGGAVLPLSFALVRERLPDDRTASGLGVLTVAFGVGSAAGLLAGGLLTEVASWRWVFGAGSVVVALASALVVVLVPDKPSADEVAVQEARAAGGDGAEVEAATRGLDLPGAALLALGLGGVVGALTEAPTRGLASPLVLGLLVGAVVALLAFRRRELSTPAPLLDLVVLRRRPVLATNVAGVLAGYALFGSFYLVPFLASSRDQGPLAAGLLLLPISLGQILAGPLAGRLNDRFGSRRVFVAGLLAVSVGAAVLVVAGDVWWQQALPLALLGAGFGLALATSNTLLTEVVPRHEVAAVIGVNSVARRVGGSIGSQVGAALLAVLGRESAFAVAFGVSAGVALLAAGAAALARPSGRHG